MGWASKYIEDLLTGQEVKFRPHGRSMAGLIESGQLCTVVPLNKDSSLSVGDIVLCKVAGNQFLHLVTGNKDGKYQISNNKGFVNGWVGRDQIFGICVSVQD